MDFCHRPARALITASVNEDCKVGFESQNQPFMRTEQSPDGSVSVITAGVVEAAPLINQFQKRTPSVVQLSETSRTLLMIV